MRVLELELVQKRVRWQQDREKYRSLRVLSFSFLSLLLSRACSVSSFSSRGQKMRENNILRPRPHYRHTRRLTKSNAPVDLKLAWGGAPKLTERLVSNRRLVKLSASAPSMKSYRRELSDWPAHWSQRYCYRRTAPTAHEELPRSPRTANRSRRYRRARENRGLPGRHRASALVEVWFGAFVAKNVLPMISPERPGVFPLRVSDAITFANCNPTILARADRGPLIGVLEPRNHLRRFRSMAIRRLVIVGQCTIKRILSRREIRGNVTRAVRPIRIIESTITASPILVPGTRTIRHRIVSTRLLADPENRRHNFLFPRITFSMARGRVLPARRKCGHGLQKRKRIVRRAIRFLGHLFLFRQNFRRRRVRKECSDRRNDHRQSMSKCSRLHRVCARRQRSFLSH